MRDRTLKALIVGGLAIAGLAALLMASHADAAAPCGDHREMEAWLAQKYGEAPIGLGTAGRQTIVQLYLSPAGTYSVVASDTAGRACIIAFGSGWEFAPPPKPSKPVDERGG